MLAWLILNKDFSPIMDVSLSGWVFIALEGICAALLGQLFYYHALKSGDVSVVVPLIATFPLFTFVMATIFLGNKVSLPK
jgi:transporter family protein